MAAGSCSANPRADGLMTREITGSRGSLQDPDPKVCGVAPDGAGPAAGHERLLLNRSADLRRASSSDPDAPIPAIRETILRRTHARGFHSDYNPVVPIGASCAFRARC